MEEVQHVIEVLKETKESLQNRDAVKLRELSNQTIHSASVIQDAGSIALAVLIYTLSKIIERQDYSKIKSWDKFEKKFDSWFDLSIKALKDNKSDAYEKYLENARRTLTSASINYKKYIEEVLRKAAINKASKIYEHGISLGQTAKLLGITQWELSEYAGQKTSPEMIYKEIISPKKRTATAMEFFS
jgi:hypothetical protein